MLKHMRKIHSGSLFTINRTFKPRDHTVALFSTGNLKNYALPCHNFVDPMTNFGLQSLFRKNKHVLVEFLNDVIGLLTITEVRLPTEVKFSHSVLVRKNPFVKSGVLNLDCRVDDGSIITVEVRVVSNSEDPSNLMTALFYDTMLSIVQYGGCDKPEELKPVLVLTISNVDIWSTEAPIDLISVHHFRAMTIQMNKFRNQVKDVEKLQSNLDFWLYFFGYMPTMSVNEKLKLIQKKPILHEAFDSLDMTLWDANERFSYLRSRMDELDRNKLIDIEVRRKAKLKIASAMLRENMDIDTISRISRISVAEEEEKDLLQRFFSNHS